MTLLLNGWRRTARKCTRQQQQHHAACAQLLLWRLAEFLLVVSLVPRKILPVTSSLLYRYHLCYAVQQMGFPAAQYGLQLQLGGKLYDKQTKQQKMTAKVQDLCSHCLSRAMYSIVHHHHVACPTDVAILQAWLALIALQHITDTAAFKRHLKMQLFNFYFNMQ